MNLYDFFFNKSPSIDDYMYHTPHIITLVVVAVLGVLLVVFAKKMTEKQRRVLLWICFGILLAFEILHRVYRIVNNHAWYQFIPMHFSSLTVWIIMIAIIVKNKHFYNFSVICGLLASLAFLLHPATGFNAEVFRFDNYYSIMTHCVDFLFSVFVLACGYTQYKWKNFGVTGLCFSVIVVYSLLLNLVFFPGANYMYYIENITTLPYIVFLLGYISIVLIYLLSFYIINSIVTKIKAHKGAHLSNP